MSDQTVFENFVMHINAHDLQGMRSLMSSDYVFIYPDGKEIKGIEADISESEKFLNLFPDYKIQINNVMHNGTTFLADGTAEGTYKGVKNASGDNYWKIPAAWKTEIENGKVKSWQIFMDTKIPMGIAAKYSDDSSKIFGFGGVFLKSKDAKALGEWYNKHLGTKFGKEQYVNFKWSERGNMKSVASTTFGLFSEKSKYFDPSTKEVMLNFRVRNLHKLLDELKSEGVTVVGTPEDYDYGKFGWIMDIDGNKIELWEPVDEVLEQFENSK